MTRRVRWECPEHGGAIIAPSRLRKVDVRRYCLPCSEAKGILVERFAPALEKEREKKAQAAKAKKQKERERQRDRENAYYTVAGVNLKEHFNKMIVLKAFGGKKGSLYRFPPKLRIRRASQSPNNCCGFADYYRNLISLTAWPGVSDWEMLELLIHELTHIAVGRCEEGGVHHGREFKVTFRDAVYEYFGVLINSYNNVYVGQLERIMRERGSEE